MSPDERSSTVATRRRVLQASFATLGLSSFATAALGAGLGRASRVPRLHIVDMMSGAVDTVVITAGRGPDAVTAGSAATLQSRYLTGGRHFGPRGQSLRLRDLDPASSGVEERAVVVHAAWYVGPRLLAEWGLPGCSEACFAVSQSDLPRTLHGLGPGHLLIAAQT